MANAGGAHLTTTVKANTPVDSGDLRASWQTKPTVRLVDGRGRTVYESGTWTDVWYADFVERGTGLYGPYHHRIIAKPGTTFSWIGPDGRRLFARSTKGMHGAHMVAYGVAKTEAEFDAIVAQSMREWQAGCYASWAAGGWR
jgi:hypothetical protein